MKRLGISILSVLCVAIMSCSSDDDMNTRVDPNALTLENLAGTWDVTGFISTGTETDLSSGTPIVTTTDIVGSDFNTANFIFTPTGQVTADGTYTASITTTINGQSTVTIGTQEFEQDSSFTLDGDMINLQQEPGVTITVLDFTSADFQLLVQETVIEPDYRFEGEATYTLARR